VSAVVVLLLLVLIAVLAPRFGADSRWEGAGLRADRPRRTARPVPAARTADRTSGRGAARPAARLRDV